MWAVIDHLEYRRLVFYPEPDADWRELVDLRLFEGFWPKMTFRDAERHVGQPTTKGEDYRGPFWDYERFRGTVRIAHELKGSVPFMRWWRLKGLPRSSSVQAVFHPNVAHHIPENRDDLEIVIMTNRRSPGAFVKLEDGKVAWIDWIRDGGARGRG